MYLSPWRIKGPSKGVGSASLWTLKAQWVSQLLFVEEQVLQIW